MALPKTLGHLNLGDPHALYGYMHAQFATSCSIIRAAGFTSYVALDATLDSRTRWPGSMMHSRTVMLFQSDYMKFVTPSAHSLIRPL